MITKIESCPGFINCFHCMKETKCKQGDSFVKMLWKYIWKNEKKKLIKHALGFLFCISLLSSMQIFNWVVDFAKYSYKKLFIGVNCVIWLYINNVTLKPDIDLYISFYFFSIVLADTTQMMLNHAEMMTAGTLVCRYVLYWIIKPKWIYLNVLIGPISNLQIIESCIL